MIRKEKPRKKQQFSRKETDEFRPKRRRKEMKQKYRHVNAWLQEEETPENTLYVQ